MDYPNYVAYPTYDNVLERNWHYYPGKTTMLDTTQNASVYSHIFTPSSFTIDWGTKPKEQPKKQENKPLMETQTITKSFRMASHSHTEGESEVNLVGVQYHSDKMTFCSYPGELQKLFESSKVGDEFLVVVIKQSK